MSDQIEIVLAGFGGQGALFAGQLLAYAAMEEGRHVTWMPSYGPEMRGGTAHCIVIVSDETIGSPIVRRPQVAVVMNIQSMEKYEPLVQPGGLLVVNASLVTRAPTRDDVQSLLVPANGIAGELGEERMANIVLLGAMLAARPVVARESVLRALKEHLPERHRHLLEANVQAFEQGVRAGQRAMVT